MEEAARTIYPDIALSRKRRTGATKPTGNGVLVLEPVTIPHELLEEERQGCRKVLHRPDRNLVAVARMRLHQPNHQNGEGH